MIKIKILKAIEYDEDLLPVIKPGIYDWDNNGLNGWGMIKVNGEWWDFCTDEGEGKIWELV